jgi:hypothetical protein
MTSPAKPFRSASLRRFVAAWVSILLWALPEAVGFQRQGESLLSDGSQRDVNAALAAARPGQTVRLPAGTFTWGDGGSAVVVNKAVKLVGAGPGQTIIQVSATAATYTNGIIRISGAAVVRDFTIRGNSGARSVFTIGGSGWRITNITYLGVANEGYFVYAHEGTGLIDRCTITGGGGNSELIFTRGPQNSWQTPSTLGTDQAVYVEDCTFHGPGYVSDFNANARGVVRFCTITGPMKIDAHGRATNTPDRSARSTEIYRNRWTGTSPYVAAIEVRGGTAMIFDNTLVNLDGYQMWFLLKEYGPLWQYPSFGLTFQTPNNYPIGDTLGTGQDITLNATEIRRYQMVRIANAGTTSFTAIGAPNNNPGTAFVATGPGTGTGTVTTAPASEPLYIWNNAAKGGVDWILNFGSPVPNGAIELYRVQTGNPTATFTLADITVANRDYFKLAVGGTFNGTGGMGRGTKAQMLAIQPTKTLVGFWVTDEGEWDSSNGGTPDGQLYFWDGSAWTLKYRPYTYPHPLRQGGAPTNVRINVRVN